MINPMDLTGKHILVTGASSGIGRAAAKEIAQLGGRVSLIARNEAKLMETKNSMAGNDHHVFVFDIREIDAIEPLMKQIVSENGKLDGLVHCAGIADMRPLQQTKYDFLHNMMLVNFYSFIEMCRVYAKKSISNGGSIVVMSSIGSKTGDKSKTAYCSSKAAVDGAIRVMAHELSLKDIRINSIIAGFVKSDMYKMYVDIAGEDAIAQNVLPRQYRGIGDVNDIANAICYLLSDAAKFITGTGFIVDGGYLS